MESKKRNETKEFGVGLIKNRVRLYIDVCGRDTDDPYDLSNKMNDLLQRKIATYSNDVGLRMGSFHPLEKTSLYYKYKDLSQKVLKRKENSEDYDELLSEMKEMYYNIPQKERELLHKEGISYPSEYEKPKDIPPTRFKVGQIVESGPDVWEIKEIKRRDTKMRIKVLEKGPDIIGSIGSYLNKGRQYTLRRHEWDVGYGSETWEIPPEKMKRDTSQVLLIWFDDHEYPCIDLDS